VTTVAIAQTQLELSDDESRWVQQLTQQIMQFRRQDIRLERYYEARQRLAVLGLAVPPELAGFETVVNWSRVAVDEPERRLDIRAFAMPGTAESDPAMREGAEYNNLQAESTLLHRDALTLGRGVVSVSTNSEDSDYPLIVVESSREIAIAYDATRRRILAALRLYREPNSFYLFDQGTLYLPDSTVYLGKSAGSIWKATNRDEHKLGRVPIVAFLNKRRTGRLYGESEMTDVIPIVDAAARSLTNLQLAQETHAVPQKYVLGISKGDFVDQQGNAIPVWESYFDAFMASANKDAKIGQLPATDLTNFTSTIEFYGKLASSVSGLPARYFGISTANPATEGSIRADESRLVKNVERMQSNFGSDWAKVMQLYLRFKGVDWAETNRISTLWFDAGTPTFSQRADALGKLASGSTPLITREGAWDELGWSDARKDLERQRFQKQEADVTDAAVQAALVVDAVRREQQANADQQGVTADANA
jgi:hypothetical protein